MFGGRTGVQATHPGDVRAVRGGLRGPSRLEVLFEEVRGARPGGTEKTVTWVYLDDHFPDHPKVVAAGGDAAWLFVCGLAYCKRYRTDGAIPGPQVGKLTDRRSPSRLAKRLVEVGLWEVTVGGFRVHDYDDWNRPAESKSEKGRKAANARWHATSIATGIALSNAQASVEHMPQHALSPYPYPNPAAASETLTHDHPPPAAAAALKIEALNLLADRRLAANGQVTNPAAYRQACLAGLRNDHAATLAMLDWSQPWTAKTLADWLEPASKKELRAYDVQHPTCATCDSTSWIPNGEGQDVTECPDCHSF